MTLERDDVFFVYGALRSGTTVFRLMLNAHPQMSNPGEMDFLFDHITEDTTHPTGWRYDIASLKAGRIFKANTLEIPPNMDGLELLGNFLDQIKARAPEKILSINLHRHIDRVFAILPRSRIIHMLRDPRDVARSSIAMGWAGTLYHGVYHWTETEKAWDRASASIAPEQILTLTYEDLFQNITPTLTKVSTFMGCPYDPAMLRYHEKTTYGPPDPDLTEQWRRKSAPQELMELESRAWALMKNRGYAPAYPLTPIAPLRRVRLNVTNKIGTWRFGMARFGFVTFWAEKLARWAHLHGPHRRVKERMDRITIQYLK